MFSVLRESLIPQFHQLWSSSSFAAWNIYSEKLVVISIGTFAFITLHFTRQPWSQRFDAEWFWCLIDRMEKFVIPLRFEFECISFGSLGQNSLVVPLPNVIQTTLHCIYIYLPTSQCQSKYIDTTFTFSLTYFYQTRVRSLAMLVSDSLTHSLTH